MHQIKHSCCRVSKCHRLAFFLKPSSSCPNMPDDKCLLWVVVVSAVKSLIPRIHRDLRFSCNRRPSSLQHSELQETESVMFLGFSPDLRFLDMRAARRYCWCEQPGNAKKASMVQSKWTKPFGKGWLSYHPSYIRDMFFALNLQYVLRLASDPVSRNSLKRCSRSLRFLWPGGCKCFARCGFR